PTHPPPPPTYPLSLHDALPISGRGYIARLGGHHRHAENVEAAVRGVRSLARRAGGPHPIQAGALYPPPGARVVFDGEGGFRVCRSEEHTSELQSQSNLVCRLLL